MRTKKIWHKGRQHVHLIHKYGRDSFMKGVKESPRRNSKYITEGLRTGNHVKGYWKVKYNTSKLEWVSLMNPPEKVNIGDLL